MGYNVLQEMHGRNWDQELTAVEDIQRRSVMSLKRLQTILQEKFNITPIFVSEPATNWQGAQRTMPAALECTRCHVKGTLWCLFRDKGSVDHYFQSVHICESCGNQEETVVFGGCSGYGDQNSFPTCHFCQNTWLNEGDL